MLRKLLTLYAAAVALAASPALAQETGQHVWRDLGAVKTAVACNASAGTRTWTASAGQGAGFGVATFQLNLTRVAATDISLICYGSLDHGTSWAQLQSCSVAAGVCTSSNASWVKSVSGDAQVPWRVDFLGYPDIRCTFACTAGGGTDLVTWYGRLTTE
jgi:hypothetical protein